MYLKYAIDINMTINAYTSSIVFGLYFVFIGNHNTNGE